MPEITKETYNTLPFKVWHNAERRWLSNEEMQEAVELKMDYGRAWIELKDHDKYEIVSPENNSFYMPDENTDTPIDCQFCEQQALPSEMKIEENGIIICPDCYDDDDDTLKDYLGS